MRWVISLVRMHMAMAFVYAAMKVAPPDDPSAISLVNTLQLWAANMLHDGSRR